MRTAAKIPIAHPFIGDEERQRVLEVLASGILVADRMVREFEEAFAAYIGVPHAVATSSGTTALQVALEALGIGAGDRVITTPFTFAATSHAILHAGARPVFADVDPQSGNLDAAAVDEAVRREGAKAVLAVHLYGLPADLDALGEVVARHGLLLIEDCAQAHGATYRGRKVGSFGDAAVFSFYPTKNMTTGEGGMVLTRDAEVARRARLLVDPRAEDEYVYSVIGYNFRLTDVAAAMGLPQLRRLDRLNEVRRHNARALTAGLGRLPWLTPPVELEGATHVYTAYTVRARARDSLMAHLAREGIGHKVFYPMLIPHTPAYRALGFDGQFPIAERLTGEVLSLPVHPALTDEDLRRIIEVVTAFHPR
jgi:dTDP-4-amino-4,6-dideoxygalactose transaminase